MKFKNLLSLILAIMCLAACKKDNPKIDHPVEKPTVEKPDPLESLKDSVSYTIDGQKISLTERAEKSILNVKSNAKLDSVVNNKEYTSGDRDSVMFGREFKFFGDHRDRNAISITFLKKYNKGVAKSTPMTILLLPDDKLDLFSVGERKFALDFGRNNSQNGIALELSGNYYGFQSYGYSSLVHYPVLKPELQSQSKFEITSLKKLKSGRYLVEAKFNASVFHGNGTNIKKIEDGYMRVKIDPKNLYFEF